MEMDNSGDFIAIHNRYLRLYIIVHYIKWIIYPIKFFVLN